MRNRHARRFGRGVAVSSFARPQVGARRCGPKHRRVAFRRLVSAICVAGVMLAGCALPQAPNDVVPAAASPYADPDAMWRLFRAIGALQGIVRAPSGDYWAAGGDVAALSRFTPRGKLTTYDLEYVPTEIAADRNGNLWFTNARFLNMILRFDPRTLAVTAFRLSDEAYGGVTLGGDGNIWFVEEAHIGKVTPDGTLTEYPTPLTQGASGLSWSADGLVWFSASGKLGYVLASLNALTGSVKLYNLRITSNAGAIRAGPKGSVWFVLTGTPDLLVRFDSKRQSVATYRAPHGFTASPCPGAMALSPNGSIWYATQRLRGRGYERHVVGGGYVRFDLRTKRFSAYPSPKGFDWNCDLVLGSRGEVWGTAGPGVSVLYGR
jgi:streptogramin lyase